MWKLEEKQNLPIKNIVLIFPVPILMFISFCVVCIVAGFNSKETKLNMSFIHDKSQVESAALHTLTLYMRKWAKLTTNKNEIALSHCIRIQQKRNLHTIVYILYICATDSSFLTICVFIRFDWNNRSHLVCGWRSSFIDWTAR